MNNEIKALIVEDMMEYISTIEMLLAEVAPWVKIAGKATSLEEAERLIGEISPDVVLLDIQFENEGKTGFDLLDSLKSQGKINFQLIIVTAHIERQYYAKAFDYKAVHFLEKPINKYKLADALSRVKDSLINSKIDTLVSIVENEFGILKSTPPSSKINVQGMRYSEIIDVNDIVWIKADGRLSHIYLQNDKKVTSMNSIGTIENQLQPFTNFFRINRSEIINIRFVVRYSKKERLIIINSNTPNHFGSKDKFSVFIQKIQ